MIIINLFIWSITKIKSIKVLDPEIMIAKDLSMNVLKYKADYRTQISKNKSEFYCGGF